MKNVCRGVVVALVIGTGLGSSLVAPCGAVSAAEEKLVTHVGTFESAKGMEFKMKDEKGKEHSFTLAKDAKTLNKEGKPCKLSDIKAGVKVRVTTKDGDVTHAIKLECLS